MVSDKRDFLIAEISSRRRLANEAGAAANKFRVSAVFDGEIINFGTTLAGISDLFLPKYGASREKPISYFCCPPLTLPIPIYTYPRENENGFGRWQGRHVDTIINDLFIKKYGLIATEIEGEFYQSRMSLFYFRTD